MRDPKLTFLIRCAYGAVWLALIWLMVRYVLVWLLPFLIALALAALLEPAVVLCRRRLHLRRGFTATVLSLVVLGTVAAGLVLLAMVLLAALIAVIDALPVFGTGTVLVPWGALCLLTGNVPKGLGLLALYGVISLVRSVLEPKIMAAQVDLSPLAALAAMYVGFCAFGVAGMVLCPMALLFVKQLHDSGWLRLWK